MDRMFGEGKFEHLVGELTMVASEKVMLESPGLEAAALAEKMKEVQRTRETMLAKRLASRLDSWVSGESEAFVQAAIAEYDELCKLNLGPEMLLSIGIQYELTANRALGLRGNDWFGHGTQNRRTEVMAKAVLGMLKVAKESGQLKEELEGLDDAAKQAHMEQFEEKLKKSIYNLMATDIESSVASAVAMCCADTSVSKEVRRARAQGIIKLGRIFAGKHFAKPRTCLKFELRDCPTFPGFGSGTTEPVMGGN